MGQRARARTCSRCGLPMRSSGKALSGVFTSTASRPSYRKSMRDMPSCARRRGAWASGRVQAIVHAGSGRSGRAQSHPPLLLQRTGLHPSSLCAKPVDTQAPLTVTVSAESMPPATTGWRPRQRARPRPRHASHAGTAEGFTGRGQRTCCSRCRRPGIRQTMPSAPLDRKCSTYLRQAGPLLLPAWLGCSSTRAGGAPRQGARRGREQVARTLTRRAHANGAALLHTWRAAASKAAACAENYNEREGALHL